ncbi:Arm DNA-binding domain-containing protein [uncultured Ruegeria sp.]|uniref:Arm DNA-binding domain-containing protein n=1 Tax=uncultured Ruegeria sp. TaxID=259304 RepID=UPI003448BFEC
MARGDNWLSATQVKNAPSGSVIQDGGGLSLKTSKNGGRCFYRFQINGKRRDMGLGSYPDMSLSDARRERSKWAAYAERGEDPIAERERQRLEAENSQTTRPLRKWRQWCLRRGRKVFAVMVCADAGSPPESSM